MTEPERSYAKPTEELAKAIYEAAPNHTLLFRHGQDGDTEITGRQARSWEEAVEAQAVARQRAQAALTRLKHLGFLSDLCFEAMRFEQDDKR